MIPHDGDKATLVAQQLQDEILAEVIAAGDKFVNEENPMLAEKRKSLFSKISFQWRTSDALILDQIRSAVDSIMGDMYAEAKRVIDDFYAELRIPEHDPDTGMVLTDPQGRVMWRRDSQGRYIEQWGQMTGQDIEKCLLDITRLKMYLAPEVNELLLEAVFAKHIADDSFQDAYSELVEETIPGRNAHASRKSRPDKYHAYFRYVLWSSSKVFLDELSNFSRILERVLYWRTQDQR